MRKQVILLIVLVLFILASIYTQEKFVESSGVLNDQLNKVVREVEADEWGKAVTRFDAAFQDWRRIAKWWTLLTEHEEIDLIAQSFQKTQAYISSEETTDSLAELKTLIYLIGHIPEKERLNLSSLL